MLNSEETLLRGVWVAGTIKTERPVNSNEVKKQRGEERKKKFLEKRIHGQFSKEISDSVDMENLDIGYPEVMSKLKQRLYYLLLSAQEQSLRTNYIKHHIDNSIDSSLCRMCGKCGERVQHIVSGFAKPAFHLSTTNNGITFIALCIL